MINEPSLYLDRGYKFSAGLSLRFIILQSFYFLIRTGTCWFRGPVPGLTFDSLA